MFKQLHLLTFILASTCAVLSADYTPSEEQITLEGQFLYLKPSFDDTYFVINAPTTNSFPNGKRKNNDFDFQPGFRVGGSYAFCNCNRDIEVYYSNINSNKTKTVTGDYLWATLGHPDFFSAFENYSGTAVSALKISYQSADGLMSQKIFDCRCSDFSVLFGLEAFQLRMKENYVYTSDTYTGYIHEHTRTRGLGLEIGFALNYGLYEGNCGCPGRLSINVFSTGSLLAAQGNNSIDETFLANDGSESYTPIDVSNSDTWRMVPAFHARVGFNYELPISCFNVAIEVGYEFNSYIRALSKDIFPDDVFDSLSFNNFYNFDLQGLYLSGTVSF